MFNLRYEFPSEWAAFAASTTANFTATLRKDYFPYMVQNARMSVDKLTLYAESGGNVTALTPQNLELAPISAGLNGTSGAATLNLPSDASILTRDPLRQVFLVLQYSFAA